MKLLIFGEPALYVDKVDFKRLLKRCQTETNWQIKQVNPLTREGVANMELYDLVSTPAFVAVRDDGSPIKIWQGDLPTFADLSAYLVSGF